MSNEDLVQELKDRIEVLEKANKSTKFNLLGVSLIAGLGCSAFLLLVLFPLLGRYPAIRARSVQVMDGNGRAVVRMGTARPDLGGYGRIDVINAHDKSIFSVTGYPNANGNAGVMSLSDNDGINMVTLGKEPFGPAVTVARPYMLEGLDPRPSYQSAISMRLDGEGNGQIVAYDREFEKEVIAKGTSEQPDSDVGTKDN